MSRALSINLPVLIFSVLFHLFGLSAKELRLWTRHRTPLSSFLYFEKIAKGLSKKDTQFLREFHGRRLQEGLQNAEHLRNPLTVKLLKNTIILTHSMEEM